MLCRTNQNLWKEKRLIFFLKENIVKPVAGAAVDAAIRTPVGAALDAPTGIAAKSAALVGETAHKAVVQQFAGNSLMLLPILGRVRGATMNVFRTLLDSKASPLLHPLQTIANLSTGLHKAIDRCTSGLVNGDGGPAVETLGGAKAAIADAKTDYQAKKEPDPRDNEISAQALPIIGAIPAAVGGAKEFFIDTHLEAVVDGTHGFVTKSWDVLKNTFSKMFLTGGEPTGILKRIAKVPTGLISGVSEATLDAEKSPLWHLALQTIPNAIKNGSMAALRAMTGWFMGDPGEQVVVGEGTAKARGTLSKVAGVSRGWLGKAGAFLKGAGGDSTDISGGTPAAA